MVSGKQELLAELAREEARLAEIERQREAALFRVDALRIELAGLSPDEPPRAVLPIIGGGLAPATPADKVRLFRALFRGREDIFPSRFVSKKTGRAGYAPACANKFVRGVCDLPRVKCSECPSQAFTPVDDRVVLDHLRGRHVMGVYPLLDDETCWFLAIDFDKSSWQEDVGAFVETCRAMDVPVAVERSRSGNGAHGWFFFEASVAASLARKTCRGRGRWCSTRGRLHRLHPRKDEVRTHLLDAGMDIRKVQMFLRHRSIAATERYLHVNVDRMGAEPARNSPLDGRRRGKAVAVRPALEMILGELGEMVRPRG